MGNLQILKMLGDVAEKSVGSNRRWKFLGKRNGKNGLDQVLTKFLTKDRMHVVQKLLMKVTVRVYDAIKNQVL